MNLSSDDDKRIKNHFAAVSRDITPTSVRHAAYVLHAPVSRDTEITRQCVSVLSPTELQKADRFVNEYDKAHFKQRRAFRRFCAVTALGSSRTLAQIDFTETESGRPYVAELPGFWFSFSSCRSGFLAAWSSTHGVGVDLEDQIRNLDVVELARQFFSDAEASVVENAGGLKRLRAFYKFWTLKEAALKSIGEGLPFGLDTFEFELDPHPRVVNAPADHGAPEQFYAHEIKGIDSYAAVVMRQFGVSVL